ncbi:hypothetical protein Droror1_Dr00019668 [Drosera rotundifolia]
MHTPMRHPELVCLPRLWSLHFDEIHDMEADFIYRIFTNSPLLENLTLYCCSNKGPGIHLLWKRIEKFDLDGYHKPGNQRPKVVIDAPSLTHFQFSGNIDYACEFKNLNALKEASVYAYWYEYNVVLNMLYAVAKVKVLHLLGGVLELLQACADAGEKQVNGSFL